MSWPEECSACEAGKCERCSGITIEGMPCECFDANHYDMLVSHDIDDDYEEGDFA